MSSCFDYVMEENILVTLQGLPYQNGESDKTSCLNISQVLHDYLVPVQIVSYVFVNPSETGLAHGINTAGIVSCAVHVTANFMAYKGGVFQDTTCSETPNHAINIVGYGCTFFYKPLRRCFGQRYWILRNSWGPTWGESGYMRIIRGGTKTCGLYSICSYVTVS